MLVGLTLLTGQATSAEALLRPLPMFVQVATLGPTYSPAEVRSWMGRICRGREVVLQDVAGQDGRLFEAYLDVIAPYLPGGSKACFSRVFVGTVDLAWAGAGSKYVEGVQDAAFQQRYLSMSDTAARAFVARYPRLKFDWYLTYEANLNQFYYPAVHQAYTSMVTAEMKNLRSIRRGAVMWSPVFAFPYSAYSGNLAGMTQLRANLVDFFATLAREAGGLQILDLQDYVAGSACQPDWDRTSPQDAVGWVNFLLGLQQIKTVELNVEQYAFNCATGTIGPGSATELAARTSFYNSQRIRLGPAFEVRYWMQVHGLSLFA